MPTDPTSIWERSPTPRRARPPAPSAPAAASPAEPSPPGPAGPPRIPLKEATRRFGVPVATLRAWARAGEIDAVMADGRQWMATPASVAARKRRKGPAARAAALPAAEGNSMLVPRDAWDRLLAQLGNLHQAGQQLAEARERAARAETEAAFLRERLGEIREERDLLRRHLGEAGSAPAPAVPRRRWWQRPFRGSGPA